VPLSNYIPKRRSSLFLKTTNREGVLNVFRQSVEKIDDMVEQMKPKDPHTEYMEFVAGRTFGEQEHDTHQRLEYQMRVMKIFKDIKIGGPHGGRLVSKVNRNIGSEVNSFKYHERNCNRFSNHGKRKIMTRIDEMDGYIEDNRKLRERIYDRREEVALPEPHPLQEEFFKAVKRGEEKVVRKMLVEEPELVHEHDALFETGLHWAAKRGDLEMVETFIHFGALTERKNFARKTPEELAEANNRIAVKLHLELHRLQRMASETPEEMTEELRERMEFRLFSSRWNAKKSKSPRKLLTNQGLYTARMLSGLTSSDRTESLPSGRLKMQSL